MQLVNVMVWWGGDDAAEVVGHLKLDKAKEPKALAFLERVVVAFVKVVSFHMVHKAVK